MVSHCMPPSQLWKQRQWCKQSHGESDGGALAVRIRSRGQGHPPTRALANGTVTVWRVCVPRIHATKCICGDLWWAGLEVSVVKTFVGCESDIVGDLRDHGLAHDRLACRHDWRLVVGVRCCVLPARPERCKFLLLSSHEVSTFCLSLILMSYKNIET